jgi:hypothetical protein
MSRKVRNSLLESRSSRLRLPVARKPAFVRVAPGVSLGYRRNQAAGTWVVRVADGRGGSWTKANCFAEALIALAVDLVRLDRIEGAIR